MTVTQTDTATTRTIAERWFGALAAGDVEAALDLMSADVEFVNYDPVPGYNDDMPWIGTYVGPQAVADSFGVFARTVEVGDEELAQLVVSGENAVGLIRERSTVRATGGEFRIEFVQWLTVRDGKIVRWKSYTDPSEIIRAMRGDAAPATGVPS